MTPHLSRQLVQVAGDLRREEAQAVQGEGRAAPQHLARKLNTSMIQ